MTSEPHLDALAIVLACIELSPISPSDDLERGKIGQPPLPEHQTTSPIAASNAQKAQTK